MSYQQRIMFYETDLKMQKIAEQMGIFRSYSNEELKNDEKKQNFRFAFLF